MCLPPCSGPFGALLSGELLAICYAIKKKIIIFTQSSGCVQKHCMDEYSTVKKSHVKKYVEMLQNILN